MEQSELQQLKARVRKLEERQDVENQLQDPAQEVTPEATPPSQRRSSVASTELVQQPDLMGPSYPVDFFTDSHQCHLMTQWLQLKVKAAVGSVFPASPEATFHCRRFHKAMLL